MQVSKQFSKNTSRNKHYIEQKQYTFRGQALILKLQARNIEVSMYTKLCSDLYRKLVTMNESKQIKSFRQCLILVFYFSSYPFTTFISSSMLSFVTIPH